MKYTQSHEWVDYAENVGIVGISEFAQQELGEIVYVELPEVGKKVELGEEIVVLESTKAAADIYSPVTGEIVEINEKLKEDPSLLNTSPEKMGWLFKIALSDISELDTLLDHEEYLHCIS